jgi:hypothetical protein
VDLRLLELLLPALHMRLPALRLRVPGRSGGRRLGGGGPRFGRWSRELLPRVVRRRVARRMRVVLSLRLRP